jgi:hypothetical protein
MRFLTILLLFGLGLAAAADTLLIKSVNGGRTWTDIDPGPPHRFLHWLHIDSSNSTLYALTQQELGDEWHLLVMDGGETWQIRQTFPRQVSLISAAAPSADTLYLAYERYDPQKEVVIAKVTNHGESMEQYRAEELAVVKDGTFNGFLTSGFLTTLKADPPAPGRLYALVTNDFADDVFALFQALWMSADGGRNWERLAPPVADGCSYPEMEIDRSDSSVYVVCGNELFKSRDGGASWTRKPFPDGERLWNLQIGPGAPAVLLGNRLGVIWTSIDGADTWQRRGQLPMASEPRFLTPHPVDPSLLFASTLDGIEKSENGDETWTAMTEYPLLAESPLRLLIDPRAPDTIYLVNWRRQSLRLGPSNIGLVPSGIHVPPLRLSLIKIEGTK